MVASPDKGPNAKWLYAAAMTGLLLAYLLAIYLPNRRDLNRLRMELDLKRQSIQVAALADDIARSQRGIEQANAFLLKFRGSANHADTAGLFGDISAVTRQAGVRTRRFDPSPAINHEDLVQLPLAIECDGTFEQVFELLRRLESLSQLIWINSLQIHIDPSQQGDWRCKLNLDVFADQTEISD